MREINRSSIIRFKNARIWRYSIHKIFCRENLLICCLLSEDLWNFREKIYGFSTKKSLVFFFHRFSTGLLWLEDLPVYLVEIPSTGDSSIALFTAKNPPIILL